MTKTVQKIEVKDQTATVANSETMALLSMIERAARDPAVDLDRMERLFQMRERMVADQSRVAYLRALADLQAEMPTIEKLGVINKNEKNEQGQKTGGQVAMTKYAKWEDVVEGITPWLYKHGFSLSFRIAQPSADRIAVTGVLGHREGHQQETTMALPIDSSGAKNNVQGWGSSVSYAKRYTAFALLNISARGEDDDGKSAGSSAKPTLTEEQAKKITRLVGDTEAPTEVGKIILQQCKVETFADIPADRFEKIERWLKDKFNVE